jgi:hypothetical protein
MSSNQKFLSLTEEYQSKSHNLILPNSMIAWYLLDSELHTLLLIASQTRFYLNARWIEINIIPFSDMICKVEGYYQSNSSVRFCFDPKISFFSPNHRLDGLFGYSFNYEDNPQLLHCQ